MSISTSLARLTTHVDQYEFGQVDHGLAAFPAENLEVR
jgi:hypothetical protein